MNDDDMKKNMEIVKLVWIILNIILVIYAICLLIYAKCFRKSEVFVMIY